jgi:P27 family predicted phage terminase small subunit
MPQPIKPAPLLLLEKGVLYDEQRDRVANTPKEEKPLVPICPKILSRAQRKEWKFFAKILKNYGLFSVANAKHLESLAIYSAVNAEMLAGMQKTGIIVMSSKKIPVYSPYFHGFNKSFDQMHKCLSELGLSSCGLASLGSLMAKAKKAEGIEEFMD